MNTKFGKEICHMTYKNLYSMSRAYLHMVYSEGQNVATGGKRYASGVIKVFMEMSFLVEFIIDVLCHGFSPA